MADFFFLADGSQAGYSRTCQVALGAEVWGRELSLWLEVYR